MAIPYRQSVAEGCQRLVARHHEVQVERYERGTELTIENWINQMETLFTVGQIPPEAFEGFMLMKIVPTHLNEIKEYQNLAYLAF